MSINATDLYTDGPAAGAKAKILLIHFDGAIDAGAAGRMAIGQLLRSLHNERVATFDADALMDYRSHRPIVTVDNWVSSPDMVMPQTVLDLVEDDMGNPILVLHGAEPDAHWESFTNAINELCERAGVEITFSLHGVPSGVPHTRPTPVHVQATDASLLPPGSGSISNHMQFPSPLSTFMQIRMGQRGIGGLALLGAVPYYMADTGYPAASSALLTSFAKFADLSLPVGDLEQGAAQDQETIAKLVEPRASKNPRNLPSPTRSRTCSHASRRVATGTVPALRLRVTAPELYPRTRVRPCVGTSVGLRVSHLRVRQRRSARHPARQVCRPRNTSRESEHAQGPIDLINVHDVGRTREGDDVAAPPPSPHLRVLDGGHEGEHLLQGGHVLTRVGRASVRAIDEVHPRGRQGAPCPVGALHRAQMIGSHARREGVAHDHVERTLARLVEDRAPVTNADLDLRGLGDGEMLTHLLGQKPVDLHRDVARIRARRGPGARKRARRAAHVERAETILGTPPRGHDGVHVLHVLELQVRGVRRVDCGRFHVP